MNVFGYEEPLPVNGEIVYLDIHEGTRVHWACVLCWFSRCSKLRFHSLPDFSNVDA